MPASVAYGEPLPVDSDSKKFVGAAVDDGAGGAKFIALTGVERDLNGEPVADLSVHVSKLSGAGETIGDTADAAVPSGTGTVSGKLRAIAEVLGVSTGAKVITDATGTIQQYMRGVISQFAVLLSRWPAALGQTTMSGSLPVALASNQSAIPVNASVLDGNDAALGAIADAAVSTDASGTVNAHVRGVVVLLVNLLSRWVSSLGQKTMSGSVSVTVASDQNAIKVGDGGASLTVDDGDTSLSVDDAGGSLTVDSGQLPAALGKNSEANSLPVVTATEYALLNAGDPTKGNLVTRLNDVALDSTDYDIRDNSTHFYVIHMRGYRNLWIGLHFNGFAVGAGTITCNLYVSGSNAEQGRGKVASFTWPTGDKHAALGVGAVGQGGQAGGAAATDEDYYNVPALGCGAPYIIMSVTCQNEPVTGSFELMVNMS